jgi:hypothetical protein
MATMTETPETVGAVTPSHEYHAEAHVLSGNLERPIQQKIEHQAPVKLSDRRGGHLVRSEEDVSIEGLITFAKGHTRVSGSRSIKNNGWITLSTSVMEGLNVFEIVTADRIVSQVSTDHPYENGHVPHVTFLGTQFKNLQVSGFPLSLTFNFGICGDRPAGDRTYLEDPTFLNTVREQTEGIARANGLPVKLREDYDKKLLHIEQLISDCASGKGRRREPITCSLVQSIGKIPIPGVESFGNILVIPEFGTVALGEIEVGEKIYENGARPSPYFRITGIEMNLGCVGHGTASGATAAANGRHNP